MHLLLIGAPQHLKKTGSLLLPVNAGVTLGPAALVPSLANFTVGSLLYPDTTTTLAQLLAVAVNNALISGGLATAPSWGKIGLTTHVSGILPVANGGTNISSYAIGDLLYASASDTLSKLADVAVGQVLVSGGVATAPAWSGTPTLAGISCTAINALTTAAESWIGPSSTTGIYFKSNNVGIGATSPDFALRVNSTNAAGTIAAYNPTTGSWSQFIALNDANSSVRASVFGYSGTTSGTVVPGGPSGEQGFQGTVGNYPFTLYTNNTARIVMLTSGYTGFGTPLPAAKIHILDISGKTQIGGSTALIIGGKSAGSVVGERLEINFRSWNSSTKPAGTIGFITTDNGTSEKGDIYFAVKSSTSDSYPVEALRIQSGGNIGLATINPTNLLSFGGNAARIFWMERHTTANNAGNSLTVQAGGATAAATDKAGGQLLLLPGISTGSAESGVTIRGCVAGGAGTGDNSLQDMIKVLGNKLGVFNTTPAVQQNHIADASGGVVIDAEARVAINAALLALETYGLLKAA